MTALAQPTEAIATLKKIAKPIPFAANDQPVAELRNIQTLLNAERYAEARDRLDRLFNDGHLDHVHFDPTYAHDRVW